MKIWYNALDNMAYYAYRGIIMDEKYLKKLEFDKVLQKLSEKAVSEMAKQMCIRLRPSTSIFEIERWQEETAEAFVYIVAKGAPSFFGLSDIRGSVKRAALGGGLSMKEFLEIAANLRCCQGIKSYGKVDGAMLRTLNHKTDEEAPNFPNLGPRFEGLHILRGLEEEINRCILAEDTMADDASPKLHKIRKEILIQENRIQQQLQSMIHSEAYRQSLQDPIITMRGGRYCLPVKAEFKANVSGMIHDQSSSGSTVFVEPMAVVQANNTIASLMAEEREEIQRILRVLGGMVDQHHEALNADIQLLAELDFIFAKGQLAVEFNAFKPELNEKGIISLPGARHPLLNKSSVVPIDIKLGGEFTTLVITGPNTGGKTVSLKTLGLLQIMGQAGLHLPTRSSAKITVLEKIFADIGDEQSIEQSLSTFSSHMVNIVEILKNVDPWSLVLFDELGAGTDPTEGAALAQTILEYLREKRVLTAATTHYSELKVYAMQSEGVENASCEFNVETLMPTYRLLIGIPGKSNAFAISKRLGLSDEIIHHAKELLEAGDIKFEDMISDLEQRRLEIEHEQEEIIRLRKELSQLEKTAAEEKEKMARQREKVLLKAKQEAKEILQRAKSEADQSITKMHKMMKNASSADLRQMEQERTKLREAVEEMTSVEKEARPKGRKVTKEALIPGTKVLLKGFDQEYSVLTTPNDRSRLDVQAGIMKMQVKVEDIDMILDDPEDTLPVKKEKHPAQKEKEGLQTDGIKSQEVHYELDLRGLLTDEGVDETDKFLDDAYLSGIKEVRIIHGKGTGAMRKAVHQYLKRAPHVKSFRLGAFGEGDSGVTVVTLK